MEQTERKINLFVIPRHRPKCLVKQDKRKSNLSNRHLKTLALAVRIEENDGDACRPLLL